MVSRKWVQKSARVCLSLGLSSKSKRKNAKKKLRRVRGSVIHESKRVFPSPPQPLPKQPTPPDSFLVFRELHRLEVTPLHPLLLRFHSYGLRSMKAAPRALSIFCLDDDTLTLFSCAMPGSKAASAAKGHSDSKSCEFCWNSSGRPQFFFGMLMSLTC